jgi:hypothetical protein
MEHQKLWIYWRRITRPSRAAARDEACPPAMPYHGGSTAGLRRGLQEAGGVVGTHGSHTMVLGIEELVPKVAGRWWLNCVAGDQVMHSCWR